MCIKGSRCAGDTRGLCDVAVSEYHGAWPGGADIDPVDNTQAALDVARFTPAEIDYLTSSAGRVLSAQQAVEAARADVLAAQHAFTEASAGYNAERLATADALSSARDTYQAATSEALSAQDDLMEHTVRLYAQTTGEDPYFMRRELETHYGIGPVASYDRGVGAGETTLGYAPPGPLPTDPAVVEAAKNDEQYAQAYARAQAATSAVHTANAHYYEASQRHSDAVRNEPQAMRDASDQWVIASSNQEGKDRELLDAQQQNSFARAQVESGVGPRASRKALSDLRTEDVVTNPDGTTNVWVYRKPDADNPHGSFTRVVAVAGDDVCGLVTEDGHVLTASTTERWHGRQMNPERHDFTVVLTDPQPGATRAVTDTGRPRPFHVINR